MRVTLAYETHSQIVTGFNGSALDFTANAVRMPVSFQGRVLDPVPLRQLMIAMHEVILSDNSQEWRSFLLDPVITVHPDEVCFEAFSNDSSAYVRLSADSAAFDIQGTPTYGTTNIDFTFALREALLNLRSARETVFSVGAGGFGVSTEDAIRRDTHFENKVDLPDAWVKGFLQVQSALAMKPFTFHVRPVDLLNVIHYFSENRNRKPPHGLRYDFKRDQPIRAILEPWNQEFTLYGTDYKGYDRMIRVWGRKRLELLLPVLPYANRVTIGVLGRGLPHFYACRCGPYTFTLVLSGWAANDWSATSALDLLAPQTPITAEMVATVYNALTQHLMLSREDAEAYTLLSSAQVEAALFRLCREGRAMIDPIERVYRSRELFAETLDFDALLAPDPRINEARALVEAGAVALHGVGQSDTRPNETKITATVMDEQAGTQTPREVVVAIDKDSRIRFAQCTCDFFRAHIMNRGPCKHILAARFAADTELAQTEAPPP